MNAIGCEAVLPSSDVVVTSQSLLDPRRGFRHVVVLGKLSLSVIVSVTLAGSAIPWPPAAAPVTVTVLFAAATSLFTAVIVTTPALTVAPAAKVSVSFALSA